jgi:hypothetical protein
LKHPPLEKGAAIFEEHLNLQTNLYVDDQIGFLEKKTLFTVLLVTAKGNKVAGSATINLAEFLADKKFEVT